MEVTEGPIAEEDVRALLEEALHTLVERDIYLLVHDLHERTITHKLAEYLQPLFSDWNVDCEYNRDGHDPKQVNLDPIAEAGLDQGSNVYPDIIVHNRGDNDDNLLIIEAKKAKDPGRGVHRYDHKKIQAFSRDLNYQFGAAVNLLVGDGIGNHFEVHFYSRGELQ